MELLDDIDKETVDFQSNYDGTEEEPVVLPARFPNLLANGAGGIAVGMATNIPPHNLGEVIDACTALIENPGLSIDELIGLVPGPDFPTRGHNLLPPRRRPPPTERRAGHEAQGPARLLRRLPRGGDLAPHQASARQGARSRSRFGRPRHRSKQYRRGDPAHSRRAGRQRGARRVDGARLAGARRRG